MHARPGLVRTLALLALVAGGLATAVPLNTYGDPPPWAPAHGKRKKGDPYTGYSGKKWDKHYGVIAGRCNREVIGEIVGAAAGGAIGARVGNGENREIAIVVGSVRLCIGTAPCIDGVAVTGKTRVTDNDRDRIPELKATFPRKAVIALVDATSLPADVTFAVSGLIGTSHFVGVDLVRLVP